MKQSRSGSKMKVDIEKMKQLFTSLQHVKDDDGKITDVLTMMQLCKKVGTTQATYNASIKRGYITANTYRKLIQTGIADISSVIKG